MVESNNVLVDAVVQIGSRVVTVDSIERILGFLRLLLLECEQAAVIHFVSRLVLADVLVENNVGLGVLRHLILVPLQTVV